MRALELADGTVSSCRTTIARPRRRCPPVRSDVVLPAALQSWERELLAPILGASIGEVPNVDQ